MAESNSAQMTLEAKLVAKIKEATFGAIIQDDDAIEEVARRAVIDALTREDPDRNWNGYGTRPTLPSAVTTAAREIAKRVTEKLIERETARLLADETLCAKITEAFAKVMPEAIQQAVFSTIQTARQTAALDAIEAVSQAIRDGRLRLTPQ